MPTPPRSSTPVRLTCSVVIPTRHRADALAACLASLRAQTLAPSEIIVVDNSDGDAATRAATEQAGARYIVEPRVGLCVARNTGARAATSDVVAYIDDDALAETSWLDALLKPFGDVQVAAVAGRIVPTEVSAEAHRVAQAMGVTVFERATPVTLDRTTPEWFAIAAFGGVGNGGNMAFHRALFAKGFAFNERTGRGTPVMAYDEHFAFLDVVDRGYRVAYTPRAVVKHPLPATLDDLRQQQERDATAFSAYIALLFAETKHRGALIRFLWEAVRRKRRAWRTYSDTPVPRVLSRGRKALALARGPFRYLLARRRAALP